jgi:hypothetical protein
MSIYQLKHVRQACGPKLVRYVQNKTRGGAAGQKGIRYEDKFALLKIGEAAESAFAKDGFFAEGRNVTFQGQAPCFVDDLVIFERRSKKVNHFQVKDVATLTWGKGAKSIASDFRQQLKLGKYHKLNTNLCLVVSRKSLARTLATNTPQDLSKKSTVIYFPAGTLAHLSKFPPMRNGLAALLGPNPSQDHLVSIGRMLMGVWADAGKAVTLKRLFEQLHESEAPLLRPLVPVTKLDPLLISVLNRIPDFKYSVENGFFVWKYGDTDSGCFPEHCGSRRFSAFARRMMTQKPRTFRKLEGELG